MWLALGQRFGEIQTVTDDCSAKDIDGDVIVFFDPHSTHHVKIDGIKNHKAVKYEYMDDPHQHGYSGCHQKTGVHVVKLNAIKRIARALRRTIDFIICPYTESYFKCFGKLLKGTAEKKLVWFPPCPDIDRYLPNSPLKDRKPEVLANGALVHLPKFTGYEFRKWAFAQPEVKYVQHCAGDSSTPRGVDYPSLLLGYAGALALCDTHAPPKYIEIPMAGCVCFAQYQEDYKRMGFKDGENCFYVDKKNFKDTIEAFRHDVEQYQHVADAGRKLIEENWTAEKFADFIYTHALEHTNGKCKT
jgi:hypothetical protein